MAPTKRIRRATKPVVRRSKDVAPTARTGAVVLDDEDDDEALPAAAQDPLAVEPLSAAEIRGLEARHSGVTEQREAMLEVLRKGTEAKLPFDPDEAASLVEPTDQHLEVHLRPKHKR
ncbi:MAG: hypothetical protein HYS27_28165 [Deltaproteobacteria bacterium]|nr:hypothetical protein [Deltaproteobacteria bacterium]